MFRAIEHVAAVIAVYRLMSVDPAVYLRSLVGIPRHHPSISDDQELMDLVREIENARQVFSAVTEEVPRLGDVTIDHTPLVLREGHRMHLGSTFGVRFFDVVTDDGKIVGRGFHHVRRKFPVQKKSSGIKARGVARKTLMEWVIVLWLHH